MDPDGIVLKREDFDGHYVAMYHPRNDENPEIKGGDPEVDWQLWHEVVKGEVFFTEHRNPFISFRCFYLLTAQTDSQSARFREPRSQGRLVQHS